MMEDYTLWEAAHVKDTLCYVTIKVGDIYLKKEDHNLNPFIRL